MKPIDRLIRLYRSVRLNLGIKRLIRHIVPPGMIDRFDNVLFRGFEQWVVEYYYRRLIAHYGADYHWDDQRSQNLDKTHTNAGYGLIHYSLVRNQRPASVLCVGSMYGYIPYMLAKGCADNNYGYVDFVDAGFDIHDSKDKSRHIYGQGFWKKIDTQHHFSYLLPSQFIHTHILTLEDFFKQHPDNMYDYIYLDGDHRYRGGKRAVTLGWQHLREEGYLCLHDIHFDVKAEGIRFGQWKVWQELTQTMPFKLEFSNHYSGIGIVQKITKPRHRFRHNFDTDPSYTPIATQK